MKNHILVACAALGVAVAAPVNAATLIVDGSGVLTGATGVDVGGSLYDVSFLDGTCAAVFGGCDSPSDIAFNTIGQATVAANSLLDQVFIGTFDDNPALTRGCTDATQCYAFIPYIVTAGGSSGVVAANAIADGVGSYGTSSSFDSSTVSIYTWARFSLSGATPVAPVPEPATWMLMLIGMAGVGYSMRRKDKQTLRVSFT